MTPRQAAVMRVLDRHSGEFAYGMNDCCQLALDVVREIRGDPTAIAAPVYASRDEADAIVQAHGGIGPMVTALLGCAPTDEAPRDGDLALVHLVGVGEALAIWCRGRPLVKTRTYFLPMRTASAKLTWSVD